MEWIELKHILSLGKNIFHLKIRQKYKIVGMSCQFIMKSKNN